MKKKIRPQYVDDDIFKLPPSLLPAGRLAGSGPEGKHCRDCLHMRFHNYSPKYVYCSKGRDSRTANGWAKTTKMTDACQLFEPLPPVPTDETKPTQENDAPARKTRRRANEAKPPQWQVEKAGGE